MSDLAVLYGRIQQLEAEHSQFVEAICAALCKAGNWDEIDGDGSELSVIVDRIGQLCRHVDLGDDDPFGATGSRNRVLCSPCRNGVGDCLGRAGGGAPCEGQPTEEAMTPNDVLVGLGIAVELLDGAVIEGWQPSLRDAIRLEFCRLIHQEASA